MRFSYNNAVNRLESEERGTAQGLVRLSQFFVLSFPSIKCDFYIQSSQLVGIRGAGCCVGSRAFDTFFCFTCFFFMTAISIYNAVHWLESEERGAAQGSREPFTQEETFRLDFLAFRKQSWEDNQQVRANRQQIEQNMYAELQVSVGIQRQHVSMAKNALKELEDQIEVAESRCRKLCDSSDALREDFVRLPTSRHATAYDQNPDYCLFEPDVSASLVDDASEIPHTAQKEVLVYVPGCDQTHGIDVGTLDVGFATEFYYIGDEIDEEGPNLEELKPDSTSISTVLLRMHESCHACQGIV